MNTCDLCKSTVDCITIFNSNNTDEHYHRILPRVRSETLDVCLDCRHLINHDRIKYRDYDTDTRKSLGKYDPLPRRGRLIYNELHFHRDIDKIVSEYAC